MTATTTAFSTAWAMPSRWTFAIPPVRDFLERHTAGCERIVDPFCGRSELAQYRNDLSWDGGLEAEMFVRHLGARGVVADCVLFDPPYSPRQVAECYRAKGRTVTQGDTQDAVMRKRVRAALVGILEPGGLALSFGWQSNGFGRNWETLEILLVQHGGAHNDTICVAQRKPVLPLFGEGAAA